MSMYFHEEEMELNLAKANEENIETASFVFILERMKGRDKKENTTTIPLEPFLSS